MIVYDAEIKRLVKPDDPNSEMWVGNVEYCKGWDDYVGMGIACLCAVEMTDGRPWVFMDDNLGRFEQLAATHCWYCGWNNRRFDNPLLEAHGVCLPWERKTWDLQEELVMGVFGGKIRDDNYRELCRGRSLDAVARVNGLEGKSGQGWMAPIDWQQGNLGRLISYCLNDAHQTAALAAKVIREGGLVDPVTGEFVAMGNPWGYMEGGADAG